MLEVEDLKVAYGRIAALRGISLRVAKGTVVGLIGPNGAGKTTLASTVAGLVRPRHGEVRFLGESLVGLRPDQIVRRGISLVPEGRHIFSTLTVRENLHLATKPIRRQRNVRADIDAVLELFPILRTNFARSSATLSGGEQQQLAIARALLSRPQLLILDEPSLGLAPKMVDTVFSTLEQLRSEGATILLIEQHAARTASFADVTYLLRTGEIVREYGRGDLTHARELSDVYLTGAR